MQTRMNVQQEGTIVSTTVLILLAASDVVALMDTREIEWHVLVSQVPLFIYLTYTLLLAITVSIKHLRGYQTLLWKSLKVGALSCLRGQNWEWYRSRNRNAEKSWRSGTRSDSSIADMLQKSRCCKSTFLLFPLEDKWGKYISTHQGYKDFFSRNLQITSCELFNGSCDGAEDLLNLTKYFLWYEKDVAEEVNSDIDGLSHCLK